MLTRFEGPLEVYDPPPELRKFMSKFQRYEPVVQDHSALSQAHRCKRKYFLRIVLGFVERVSPQYFGFGSCYHKFREILEKQYQGSAPYEPTDAVGVKLRLQDWVTVRNTEFFHLRLFSVALQAARDLWKKKKMRDPPPDDKWSFLTEKRLIESCATAFKHWQREKVQGRVEVIAVEQNFVVPLPNGTKVAGKADQIVRWNGKLWGRDFKTSSKEQGAYFTRTLDPNDQFTRYTWAESELSGAHFHADGKIDGNPINGQIIEVLYNAKPTKKEQKGPSIHTHLATRSATQLAAFVKEQIFYDKILTLMRDEDVYPMEPAACSFCEFHSVCKIGGERAMMAKLEAEFRVEPWDCSNRIDVDD